MHNLQSEIIQCPYCGEQIDVVVDCSVNNQEYIEDCSVCCRPIIFSVASAQGEVVSVDVRTEDE
ncbi:conserved hypothetical protein [Crenothrix polyspora]|uniref:CPXCG motif-containing cysteine-rich protein n=1 Tax=Crenothrix polyspora TaxID=360316 RepID=A0A1R4H2J3_9GAMM|nr:CPXCG motif-containing cysteine-rich protein [Crenothrix polyspora]SJM90270.1 conserved hypothetical protein [Crenothrix polyspora]